MAGRSGPPPPRGLLRLDPVQVAPASSRPLAAVYMGVANRAGPARRPGAARGSRPAQGAHLHLRAHGGDPAGPSATAPAHGLLAGGGTAPPR